MTIINVNSISGINSITAQGASGIEFYDSSGNSVQTVTGDGLTVGTGATISGSTNTITASTNGEERLRIVSDGKIGIGTTNPTNSSLVVAADATNTVGDGNISLTAGTDPLWTFRLASPSGDFNIDRFFGGWSTTPTLTIDRGTGNIGIGTDNPTSKLHVIGEIKVGQSGEYTVDDSRVQHNVRITSPQFTGRGSDAYVDIKGDSSATSFVRVLDNGNVGIGSTIPTVPLNVAGAATFAGRIRGDGGTTTTPALLLSANDNAGKGLEIVNAGSTTNVEIGVDGTATFLGSDIAIGRHGSDSEPYLFSYNTNGTSANAAFGVYNNAGNSVTARINHNGSAAFTGTATFNTTSDFAILAYSNGDSLSNKASIYARNITTGGRVWAGESAAGATTSEIFENGSATFAGAVSKGSGSFRIDHPLKSETHHLVHSFIEGPQADNLYRGKVTLIDGTATINIDTVSGMTEGTFVALNREIQCFTTNETGWTAIKGSVTGNLLTIVAQDNTCTDSISWLVIGERQDQHMYDTEWTDENGKVIVEPDK